jgi:hypothetical protein
MNAQRERCVAELTDASCDSLVYGCLVALMAQGPGEHRRVTACAGYLGHLFGKFENEQASCTCNLGYPFQNKQVKSFVENLARSVDK